MVKIRVGNLLLGFSFESLVFWHKEQIALSLFLKEQIALFTLFVKSDERHILSSPFWKSDLLFFVKSKPKSVIWIFMSRFQFPVFPLLKRVNHSCFRKTEMRDSLILPTSLVKKAICSCRSLLKERFAPVRLYVKRNKRKRAKSESAKEGIPNPFTHFSRDTCSLRVDIHVVDL